MTWIGELIRQGYLARTGDTYPVIRLTCKSKSVGKEDTPLRLSLPEREAMKKPGTVLPGVTPGDEEKLFLHLKTLRKSIADQAVVPPYVIFPDRSLREMALTKPCDLQDFLTITGVGEIKQEKYGVIFTSAIKTFCEENETG